MVDPNSHPPATAITRLAKERWDAVIVGAGPAGGVAGAILAAKGWRTLLVERASWPRQKVCGGCLNANAVRMLHSLGLASALAGSTLIDRTILRTPARSVVLPMPAGLAISRDVLDSGLVTEFQRRGGTFVSNVTATLLPVDVNPVFRTIGLRSADAEMAIEARIVLACDGISGTLLKGEPTTEWDVAADAWIGVSTTLADDPCLQSRSIHMHVADDGYVGIVRLADGSAHLAAALCPDRCRTIGGPGELISQILERCGHSRPALDNVRFQGTGHLTRRRRVLGGHRVLTVGDACGYVEPFTGEGMAWAIQSAARATSLLPHPLDAWPRTLVEQWMRQHRSTIQRQHARCRMIRYGVRRPRLAATAMNLLAVCPQLAGWTMR